VIVALSAVTVGLAIAVAAVIVGLLALLVRVLRSLDSGNGPPDSTGTGPAGRLRQGSKRLAASVTIEDR
jgi:hypothetical protein